MAPLTRFLLLAVLLTDATPVWAQRVPARSDTRHGDLRDTWLGLLSGQAAIAEQVVQHRCLDLPVDPPDERFEGPHGDSLIGTACDSIEYRVLVGVPAAWAVGRYAWRSVFTAEDSDRGPDARDTLSEEDVVLFEMPQPGQVRAVWHQRHETGGHGTWRSVTPDLAPTAQVTLLSVERCFNGTGGCRQEFLVRHRDGRWFPVWQVWADQLPAGFAARLLHGSRIDPQTLEGEAGFYGPNDGNRCPSQRLLVTLALRGDSLILSGQVVVPQ